MSTGAPHEWLMAAAGGAFFALSLTALIGVVCGIAARWTLRSSHPPDPGRIAMPATRSCTLHHGSARTAPRRSRRNEHRRRTASKRSFR